MTMISKMLQRIHRLLLVLLLLGLVLSSTAQEQQEECVVGSNGEQVCPQQQQQQQHGEEQQTGELPAQPTLDQLSIDNSHEQDCVDTHEECALWASVGECQNNPGYMLNYCPKSCKSCRVETDEQRQWADATVAFGERQTIPSQNVMTVVQTMVTYMTDTVQTNDTYAATRDECRNRHAQCSEWAAVGECQANPAYMRTNCAPTCQTCEQLDFKVRCPFDKDAPKVLQHAGDLNQWFERLLDQATTTTLRPTIVSAPAAALERRKEDPHIDISDTVLRDGPWVVTIPNFLSPAECEHLIALGAKQGYDRSKDVGAKKFDGTFEALENPRRTSTNAWCTKECFDDPVTQELTQRLEELTGIPANNSEYWQLLKYEEGQEYMEHHDWIDYQLDRSEGVRILTVFLYLNTVADDGGGGTRFTNLDLTVQPVVGSVLIWPSTLDQQPDAKDPRTNHQAMPLQKGIKYGANAWIHQRDYKTPHEQGCT